jgi:hypothetical protein
MDRTALAIDPRATKLRRVGRLARRRMRIDGDLLVNGLHTDGTVTVEISGLGSPVAGVPESFEWEADRPISLVIVRSGLDGEDVAFQVGPTRFGTARGAAIGDGSGIRYVAFCYDAAPGEVSVPVAAAVAAPEAEPVAARPALPVAASVAHPAPLRRGIAAARSLPPTRRDRRSILAQILQGTTPRRVTL